MNTNKIDEIIIKRLQESERRNEIFADEAKPRVWQAIEKHKERKTVNWWLVLAMAAAISFFLVSTFLFLKFETQKKELLALQSYMNYQVFPKKSTYVNVLPEKEEIIENKHLINKEPIPVVKREITISQVMNLESEADEGIEVSSPIISEPNLALITVSKPEIDVSKIFHEEPNPPVVHIPELPEETVPEPKLKKQSKLRLKFGNGSKVHDYQNSYALNIKI